MIHIETFKAEDWYLNDPYEVIDCTPEAIKSIETLGMGISIFEDNKCIGSGGLIYWKEDEAEAWIRMDKCIVDRTYKYLRAIIEAVHIVSDLYEGYLFCWVNENLPVNQRFVEWFGFTKREEIQIKNDIPYRLWELIRGTSTNGRRSGRKCCRSNATGKHSQTTGCRPSEDKRI